MAGLTRHDNLLESSIRRIRHLNIFDAAPLSNQGFGTLVLNQSRNLFGHEHIGWMDRSNMQVPGQFGGDHGAVLLRWYARTNIPLDHPSYPAMLRWAHHTHARLEIGSRPEWHLTLAELFARRPVVVREDVSPPASWTEPWPLVLPPRQNFRVRIDQFAHNELHQIAYQWWEGDNQPHWPSVGPPPMIWVHLEGITGEYDGALERACAQLAQRTYERKSVEDSIAAWIMGVAKAETSDKAALEALADGVLAGLHRG